MNKAPGGEISITPGTGQTPVQLGLEIHRGQGSRGLLGSVP